MVICKLNENPTGININGTGTFRIIFFYVRILFINITRLVIFNILIIYIFYNKIIYKNHV